MLRKVTQIQHRFLKDQNAAVTVDWVVLTASVVGLAVIAYIGIHDSTESLRDSTATALETELGKYTDD